MDADLDTLATALYVTTDDFLADNPQHRPWRPKVGLKPRLSDAELVTLMVMQALLGFTSEARWLRYANTHLRGMFPDLPTQSGYNKRVRTATGVLRAVFAHLVECYRACQQGGHLAAVGRQRRETSCRTTVFQTVTADHRIHQQHAQTPIGPRTPRRAHHRGSRRPRPATRPRPHRRDLAQRALQPARPAITDRLRPLTPWNHSSSGSATSMSCSIVTSSILSGSIILASAASLRPDSRLPAVIAATLLSLSTGRCAN